MTLRRLASGKGDLRDLEGPLRGYSRLRVGPYRVVLARETGPEGKPRIRGLHADRRDVVYSVFSDVLRRRLLG